MSTQATPAITTDEASLSREEARGLLSEALAMSGADQTIVVLQGRHESLTRFANNEIHQNVSSRGTTLTLQAIVGSRSGIASTTRLDSSALRQVADRALALARLAPEDDRTPSPAPAAEIPKLGGFVGATAACTPEARADAIAPVCHAAADRGLNAAGALTTTAHVRAVANTAGAFAHHADTYAHFTCTVRSPDSSGWVDRHRRDWRELDVERLGQLAIHKAEASRDPGEITPGRITVVLEPAAVAELVAFLAWLGLGAQSEQEGRSFLSGRIGERVTGSGVQLADDAYHPLTFGCPFDFEGTPRQRVTLIEDGIARGVVHDRRTALAAGVASTGHATEPPALEGPLPYDLVLAPGTESLESLIAGTEHGVLVTRFWYNRVVDARRTLVTGMTRDGTFLIENGRLTRGLRNLRFNESVLDVLARSVAASRESEPTRFDYTQSCVVVPALRVRDFQFTGVTRF